LPLFQIGLSESLLRIAFFQKKQAYFKEKTAKSRFFKFYLKNKRFICETCKAHFFPLTLHRQNNDKGA
jgi:hypothetical protein